MSLCRMALLVLLLLYCYILLPAGAVHPVLEEPCTFTESEQMAQLRMKSYQYTMECENKRNFYMEMVKVNNSFNKLEVSLNGADKETVGMFIQLLGEEQVYFRKESSSIKVSSCHSINDTLVFMNFSGTQLAYISGPNKEVWIKYKILNYKHCCYSGKIKLEMKEKEKHVYHNEDGANKLLKRIKRQEIREGNAAYLLINSGFHIYQYSLDGQRSSSLLSTSGLPVALTYDLRRRFVFWSEYGLIQRANLNGSGIITLYRHHSFRRSSTFGMAADWITGNLYFTDHNRQRIRVIDKSLVKTLFQINGSYFGGIVVDPKMRMMYWTQYGSNVSIQRASMDGTNRETLHNTNLSTTLYGLTIDYESQTLYWAHSIYLESSKVDGSNRMILSSIGLLQPFGITLYQRTLYITDWRNNQLKTFFLENQGSVNVLASLPRCTSPYGIDVISLERQEMINNPCQEKNGGCSHLCLLSDEDKDYTCACPDGLTLMNAYTCTNETTLTTNSPADIYAAQLFPSQLGSCRSAGYTTCCDSSVDSCEGSPSNCFCDEECYLYNDCCSDVSEQCSKEVNTSYFVISVGESIHVLDTKTFSRKRVIVSNLNRTFSVDYNLKKNMLYWTDDSASFPGLWRSYLDGTSPIPVLVNETINYIAIDWITDKIYWTNSNRYTVNVMDLNTGHRRILFSTAPYIPRDISVDPNSRELYWAERHNASTEVRLIKSSMDGDGQSVLLTTERTIAFTINYANNIIYWTNGSHINSIKTDGSDENFISITDFYYNYYYYYYYFLYFSASIAQVDNMTFAFLLSFRYSLFIIQNNGSNNRVPTGISGCTGLRSMKIVGMDYQPSGYNPCEENNGGCSDLCLLSSVNSSGYTCACNSPDSISANADKCSDKLVEPLLKHGTCKEAGIGSCCYNQLGCHGSPNTCRCDVSCIMFKDCCSDAATKCSTQDRSRVVIKVSRQFGSLLGGVGVFIEVSDDAFLDHKVFSCKFGSIDVNGKQLNSSFGVCISPLLQETGYIPLQVTIDDLTRSFLFLSMSPENAHGVKFSAISNVLLSGDSDITVMWPPEALVPSSLGSNVTVAVTPMIQTYKDNKFQFFLYQLPTYSQNDGVEKIKLQDYDVQCESTIHDVRFKVCPMVFKVSIIGDQYLSGISLWTGTAYYKSSKESDEEIITDCERWKSSTQNIKSLLDTLQPCPPTLLLAVFDLTYEVENMVSYLTGDASYQSLFMNLFHPGLSVCYRQSIPISQGAGQQCCYDRSGVLVKQPIGGSADSTSPLRNYNRHVMDDLVPYILCCKGPNISRCEDYYEGRPEGSEDGYLLLIPACVYGDPHIVTLDGHKYTFNGKGEFTLIQTESEVFSLQGRMEQVVDNEGQLAPGTAFTAIVATQLQSNISVQFEIIPSTGLLQVLVNEEDVNFDEVTLLQYEDVVLQDKGNETVQALFSSGANVEITVSNGIISVMLVALPESMKRKTSGLMGPYNEIISDDLTAKGGGQPLPLDDTLENIHYKFGITWIISNASESHFTYAPGKSWATYYFPDFIPMFGPSFTNTSLEKEAKEMCGEDKFCLFDVAATRRVEIGAATKQGQEMLNTIMEMSKPIICSPACTNGVCLENNTCSCNIGYRGERCTEPVLEQCDINPCQNNGNCIKQALTVSCTCSQEFTGIFCQRKVPSFQIHFINSSPRVSGNDISIEFLPSKTATSRCNFDGHIKQCSNGILRYKDVSPGIHNFSIASTSNAGERIVTRRQIFVGPCGVNLINDGVTINDKNATIEFVSTSRNLLLFHCKLMESGRSTYCRSPLRYYNLRPGQHHIEIKPIGCSGDRHGRLTVKLDI